MGRILLIVFVVMAIAVVGGFFALGTFPPEPRTELITKTLPNDRFGPKR